MNDFVDAGMGIGLAALWYVGPKLKKGDLCQVLPDYTVWPKSKIWAVRPYSRLMPARVKVFLDFMGEGITRFNEERYGGLEVK